MVTTEIRVIYGDTDRMGVVYYGNYLRYFEAGRDEFIRARGLRYRDFEERHHLMLPVVEAAVQYKQPARYDDVLSVVTELSQVKRASARFAYRIVCEEKLIATGYTVHACVDADGKIARMPKELIDRLLPALTTA